MENSNSKKIFVKTSELLAVVDTVNGYTMLFKGGEKVEGILPETVEEVVGIISR